MANAIVISSAGGTNLNPWKHATAFLLRHSAELDVFGQHRLVEDPEEAELAAGAAEVPAGVDCARAAELTIRRAAAANPPQLSGRFIGMLLCFTRHGRTL